MQSGFQTEPVVVGYNHKMLAGFININKYLFVLKGMAGKMKHSNGTEGRTRTDKVLLPGDFESPVSTNSTTPAKVKAHYRELSIARKGGE